MQAKDLQDWSILGNFTETSGIKKVYVFENKALMLKSNGILLGIGKNDNHIIGCLNESTNQGSFVTINAEKSGKFKDFTTNGEHGLAINEDGFLFSWGANKENQLGRNGPANVVTQVSKVFGVRVAEFACGNGFSCVLTTEGKLYEWGINGFKELLLDCSNESTTSHGKQEESEITGFSIFCTKYYPVVLTSSGKVFIPTFPRLSNKCNNCLHYEKMKAFGDTMKNKRVMQILSGKSYAFALTNNGEIFKWTVSPDSVNDPERIGVRIGRPIKLWASTSHEVLVAANSYGNLFSICWTDTGKLLSVSRLSFPSVGKYFASLGMQLAGPVYDQEWINVDNEETPDVSSEWRGRFESAFNKKEGSDIAFNVGEGIIYAHRAILSIQCSYLDAMLKNGWTENSDNSVITIKEFSHQTYLRFLRYLYTGKLELASHEGNLELLQLAHEYVEKPLLDICKNMASKGLTVENAFSTYNIANLLELEDMRSACKSFMSKNLEDVVFSDDMSSQEKDVLLRSLRDMVCSKNIQGQEGNK